MATIKEMLTANTADILEATELLEVLGDREGQFVWKQLTAEGGDFVAFVTADDEGSYPNKGTQDGFYYVKFDPLTAIAENIREGVDIWGVIGAMSAGVSGIDYGTVTLTEYTNDITIEHSLGTTPSWVGITRTSLPSFGMVMNLNGLGATYSGVWYGSLGHNATDASITFNAAGAIQQGRMFADGTYYWFAIV